MPNLSDIKRMSNDDDDLAKEKVRRRNELLQSELEFLKNCAFFLDADAAEIGSRRKGNFAIGRRGATPAFLSADTRIGVCRPKHGLRSRGPP